MREARGEREGKKGRGGRKKFQGTFFVTWRPPGHKTAARPLGVSTWKTERVGVLVDRPSVRAVVIITLTLFRLSIRVYLTVSGSSNIVRST